MLPPVTAKLSMSDLLGLHARQLAKREEDLVKVHENVVKTCFAPTAEFIKQFENTIRNYDFQPGDLVLVLNRALTPESNNKCKPQYFGPMIVVHCAASGSYCFTEIDGVISRLKFMAFCLVPYLARSKKNILITKFINQKDLRVPNIEELSIQKLVGDVREPQWLPSELFSFLSFTYIYLLFCFQLSIILFGRVYITLLGFWATETI